MNDMPDLTELNTDQGNQDQWVEDRWEVIAALCADKHGLAEMMEKNFHKIDLNDDFALTHEELRTAAIDESQTTEIRAAATVLDANYDILRKLNLENGTAETLPTRESQKVFDEFFHGDPHLNNVISMVDLMVLADLTDPKNKYFTRMSIGTRENELVNLIGKTVMECTDCDQETLRNKFKNEVYVSGVPRILEEYGARQQLLESWVEPKYVIF